jgi:hypothetical protein
MQPQTNTRNTYEPRHVFPNTSELNFGTRSRFRTRFSVLGKSKLPSRYSQRRANVAPMVVRLPNFSGRGTHRRPHPYVGTQRISVHNSTTACNYAHRQARTDSSASAYRKNPRYKTASAASKSDNGRWLHTHFATPESTSAYRARNPGIHRWS